MVMTVMVTIPGVPDSGAAHAMDAIANDAPIATAPTTACVVEISSFMAGEEAHTVGTFT